MTTVYAESSAVLRWLLGTADAGTIETALASAPAVVTSELTSAEVGRSLLRLVATGHLEREAGQRAWTCYAEASAHWHVYSIGELVLARVRQPFPREPVRRSMRSTWRRRCITPPRSPLRSCCRWTSRSA